MPEVKSTLDGTESLPATIFSREGRLSLERAVASEYPLTIIFNNTEMTTLLCSPYSLECLAVGFLSSEGFLKSRDEVKSITLDRERGVVRVETVDDRDILPRHTLQETD